MGPDTGIPLAGRQGSVVSLGDGSDPGNTGLGSLAKIGGECGSPPDTIFSC